MLSYILICGVALAVAALTLFSGFGLGTLLMPAFAVFFPLQVAIAATAIVHLVNNLFKVTLVGRNANWGVVLRFGIPAAAMTLVGALLLGLLDQPEPLFTYTLAGQTQAVRLLPLVIGLIMIGFAVIELHPRFNKLAFDARLVPVGGMLSGFFGGLSGHQGALRSAFLVRLGLSRDAFIGTGVVCAVIIDLCRLPVYLVGSRQILASPMLESGLGLVLAGTLAAFAGTYLGTRLVRKITMRTIQWIVGVMLLLFGLALVLGLLPEK